MTPGPPPGAFGLPLRVLLAGAVSALAWTCLARIDIGLDPWQLWLVACTAPLAVAIVLAMPARRPSVIAGCGVAASFCGPLALLLVNPPQAPLWSVVLFLVTVGISGSVLPVVTAVLVAAERDARLAAWVVPGSWPDDSR